MYLYFDNQGVLKEFINDEALRQGSENVNTIYAYFESEVLTGGVSNLVSVAGVLSVNGGTSQALDLSSVENKEIPYNAERDLYFFKYGVTYRFHKCTLSAGNLSTEGLAVVTLYAYTSLSPVVVEAQGTLTFNIQSSNVMANTLLSQSDLTYLIGLLASKEDAVNKVNNFDTINATVFPTTNAVANYVESKREIEYVNTTKTFAEVGAIFTRNNLPVLIITDGTSAKREYLVSYSAFAYIFARVEKDMVYWHQIASNNTWTNGSYHISSLVVVNSNGYTLTDEEYNLVANNPDTVILYKFADNQWIYLTRGSNTNQASIIFWGNNLIQQSLNGVLALGYYRATVNTTTKQFSISNYIQTTYTKDQIDTLLANITNNYLINASAVGDTLTINGKYNGNSATTTFDISHKLDKNFSGVSYNEASSVGQNDYFVINVAGTPKKISWDTIYTQLRTGGMSQFLGTYTSLAALELAHPTASAGDYAYITEPDGADTILTMAIWDSTDNEWQVQDLSVYVLDSVYQSDKTNLQNAINGKVTLVEWS